MFRPSFSAAVCAVSCCLSGFAADGDPKPLVTTVVPGAEAAAAWTLEQRASYVVGSQFGERLKSFSAEWDAAKLMAGLQDALAGKESAINPAEAQQVMNQFQQDQQGKEAKRGSERKESNAKWLAENAKKPGVKATASGLQYEVVSAGKGKQPTASDTVSVHYQGTLTDGKEFDSSYKRGQPVEFQVGGVIKGWTEALQLMHEGDKWKLYIPSELAYGENGPPGIGSNQILIFEVELLKVVAAGAAPAPGAKPAAGGAKAP